MPEVMEGIVALARGLLVTLRHLVSRPVTVQYPEEQPPLPPRARWLHELRRAPDGRELCIGCDLCSVACPADAIYVKAAENPVDQPISIGERYAEVYTINELRCIFCGMCEEACPTGAIVLTTDFNFAYASRQEFIYTKEMLLDRRAREAAERAGKPFVRPSPTGTPAAVLGQGFDPHQSGQ